MSDIVETSNTARRESIRRLVSIGFSNKDLTDDDITDDVYLGAANRYVKGKVPNWESLTGDALLDLEVAVCKKTAAEILKSVARPTEIDRSNARARLEFLAIQDTIIQYETEVDITINKVNPEAAGSDVPYFYVIDLEGSSNEDP